MSWLGPRRLREHPDLEQCSYSIWKCNPLSTSELFAYYDRLRAYVQHEDGLIKHTANLVIDNPWISFGDIWSRYGESGGPNE